MQERVVITGRGTINPLGYNFKETWENLIAAKSGVGPLTLFDTSDFFVKIACEVKDFNPKNHINPKEARRMDRYEQFALIAAREAIADSGLEITEENAGRIGVIVASAVGGFQTMQESSYVVRDHGPRKLSPFFITMVMPNGGAGMIGIETGAKGPTFSIASACASGSDAIGMSWHLIRSGIIDAAITGSADATINEVAVGSFDRIQAMSRRTDDTPSPFDRDRDGLVMGEGSAVLIMESESHAKARGANILGVLAGYASTADAYHVTAPADNGAGGAAAMQQAADSAHLNLDDIGYISAHGTATPLNDKAETTAIKAAFGDIAKQIPVSSTKSMTGHMMGTTGALEAIFCIEAIRNGVLPPTINYNNPDPFCDLDYIPNQARETSINAALSNAFGFGGHNAVLCLKAYDG